MKKVRISSWEMDGHLFAAVEAAKAKRGSNWTWRRMQSEGLRLLLASWGEPVAMAEDSGEGCAHANNVERVQPMEAHTHSPVPAAVVPAAVVPAAVVPAPVSSCGVPVFNSPNEKKMYWLTVGRAEKQALLDEAPKELEREPGSLRALNWLARMPGILAKYDRDIAELKAEMAAEEAAKENSGEVIEAGEV